MRFGIKSKLLRVRENEKMSSKSKLDIFYILIAILGIIFGLVNFFIDMSIKFKIISFFNN
ncbi:hypothetical protein [Fusobacterium ulcerans]|uniref:hypothetical protein n=1 Tax=Fusobacterium ulcerans TaxID=861 RepID=UPI00241F50B3|nr:hypothetical protein [Fusobacterium ulcerans]